MQDRWNRPSKDEAEALERFKAVVAALRSPDGCPWDRAQTHESLTRGMIEEAYEVVEAIENRNADNLKEELGDVLLQIVMHAQIAEENGAFTLREVVDGATEKMVRRHPHVFGDESAETRENHGITVDNISELWNNVKRDERGETSYTEEMKRVPRHLPALLRSEKIQIRAKRAGFDWEDVGGAFEKIGEEIGELLEAYRTQDMEDMRHEVGDVLYAAVNIARFLEIDPEDALHRTSERFVRRFSRMEEQASRAGRSLNDLSLEEWDELWELAKEEEQQRAEMANAGGKE